MQKVYSNMGKEKISSIGFSSKQSQYFEDLLEDILDNLPNPNPPPEHPVHKWLECIK